MVTYRNIRGHPYRRRAIVAVQVGIMMVVLIGFAALTVDVGNMYNARGDLQRTADAAALAGASAFTTDQMMLVRLGTGDAGTLASVVGLATDRVIEYGQHNPLVGTEPTVVAAGDITTGWINLNSASDVVHTNSEPKDFNAISVIVRRESGGANGTIPLYFAPIFGKLFAESNASAVAVFDDRVSGFTPGVPGSVNTLPFTISEDAFDQDLAAGGDQYGWDDAGDAVYGGADGIREVRLYPYPLSGGPYSDGDGNFGMLNIGTENQGASAEEQQILNGLTPADLEAEIGTAEPSFYDDDGNPITYEITGSPGLTASLQDTLDTLVGQVVSFFLHEAVVLDGANATYTITGIRYGRLMDVRILGQPDLRGVYIQPVSYSGSDVKIDPDAPSTNGLVGRIVLAR